MALAATTREEDGVAILTPDGRLIFGEDISALRQTVKDLIAHGKKKIVLNMEHVVKIDSVGLGVLIAVHNTAMTTGTSLRLCNLGKQVKEVLQVTKLINILEVYGTEDDALRAFTGFSARA